MPGARIVITVAIMFSPSSAHRDADEREEDDVAVHPHVRLVAQRRVAGPAGREAAVADRRHQDHAGRHQQPERERLDARERHPPRADHDRHEVVRERAEDPARHHPHHHRAVQADERQVVVGVPRLLRRAQQLEADQHRVQPADEDEDADPDQVLDADDLVVGAEPEVAARRRPSPSRAATAACRACAGSGSSRSRGRRGSRRRRRGTRGRARCRSDPCRRSSRGSAPVIWWPSHQPT